MELRIASFQDIPKIVQLLKLSLGESLLPKSEDFWIWKHVNNPFGASPVMLAEEDEMLIGVRSFMRWNWLMGQQEFHALRAVDTATHPEFQGKGVFRRLTMELVDHCKKDGYDFIFNTPNSKSKPGYLKMGWISNGKFPLQIIPAHLKGIFSSSVVCDQTLDQRLINQATAPSEEFLIKCLDALKERITTTDYSVDYLRWRYCNVPGIQYHSYTIEEDGWSVFYRPKVLGRRKELRVCDLLYTKNFKRKSLREFLYSECRRMRLNFITMNDAIKLSLFGVKMKVGPEVTFRDLNMKKTPPNWVPSIGDLELF